MAGFRNHIWYELLDEEGVPVSGASIWLYEYKSPTTQLRIFDVNDDTLSQPLTTDIQGIFDFFVRDNIYSRSTGYTWDTQFIISWSKDDKSGIIRGDHLFGEYESASTSGNLSRLNKVISNNLGWIYNTHVDGKFGLLIGCGSSSSSSSSLSSSSSSSLSSSSSSSSQSSSSSSSISESFSSSSSSTAPILHTFTIQASANDGYIWNSNAVWATARNSVTGASLDDVSTNTIIAYTKTGFNIIRGFFDFDLSEIPSAGRVLDSVRVDITGQGFADTGAQMTAQVASGAGSLTLDDYNNFSGSQIVTGARDWELWDGGDPFVNKLYFNTLGENFIKAGMGSFIRICCREYDHDYLDVQPTGNSQMGGYYSESLGGGNDQNWYAPKIVVKYYKSAQWLSAIGPSYWSVDVGSWDGSKYISSVGGALELSVAGAWYLNFHPTLTRITFDFTPDVWVEIYNSDGSDNIAAEPQQQDVVSGEELEIINYNSLPLDAFWMFDSGTYNITNIEFLIP